VIVSRADTDRAAVASADPATISGIDTCGDVRSRTTQSCSTHARTSTGTSNWPPVGSVNTTPRSEFTAGQAFSGVGYQSGRFGVSIGYRHLAFNQGSSAKVQKLVLGGPILAANFSF